MTEEFKETTFIRTGDRAGRAAHTPIWESAGPSGEPASDFLADGELRRLVEQLLARLLDRCGLQAEWDARRADAWWRAHSPERMAPSAGA